MTEILRPVVVSADRRRVLAQPRGLSGWALPEIPVDDTLAWNHAVDDRVAHGLGARVAPVRRIGTGGHWAAEPAGPIPAVGVTWIALDDIERLGHDAELAGSVLELAGDDDVLPPHLRFGWRDEIRDWSAQAAGVTALADTLQHWELGAVVLAEHPDGAVVVKEPGPGFDAEAGIVGALDGLPGAPRLLAADGRRLVTAHAGHESPTPVAFAAALGRLQRAAVDRAAMLEDIGVPMVEDLVDDPRLRGALDEVMGIDLPRSVVHADAHAGNGIADGDAVTVIDWTDATLGCPAIDLDLLIGHGDAGGRTVVETWCEAFGCAPDRVLASLPALRIVAAGLASALHARNRPLLPPSGWPLWDRWHRHWIERLDRLLADDDGGTGSTHATAPLV